MHLFSSYIFQSLLWFCSYFHEIAAPNENTRLSNSVDGMDMLNTCWEHVGDMLEACWRYVRNTLGIYYLSQDRFYFFPIFIFNVWPPAAEVGIKTMKWRLKEVGLRPGWNYFLGFMFKWSGEAERGGNMNKQCKYSKYSQFWFSES